MAKTVRIKSELKTKKNKAFWHMSFALFFTILFLCVGIAMLCVVLINNSTLHIAFPFMFLALSGVLLYVWLTKKKEYEILNSGVKGEKQTYEILKCLPKDFTVITNPVIYNRGSVNELDFVVIGTNGVFVVETKNYHGIIKGSTSAQNWKQIKYGKNKTFEKEVKNPVKQVYRQGRRMTEMFIDIGVSADVFPILYFIDNRSELKIIDDAEMNIAIINDENDLLDFIMNSKGKHIVDNSERAEIIRFFKK
ncbi:MAG: NERD domain-containing protein [Clostridia bacterium]|nr:NERD domain-containing protein [Clostridia bacterium]